MPHQSLDAVPPSHAFEAAPIDGWGEIEDEARRLWPLWPAAAGEQQAEFRGKPGLATP
jgi:hypothetical protein